MDNPRNDFADVKSASDLVQYITAHTEGQAKQAGASVFINPCPHCGHKDCCAVDPAKQLYKCHSCGAGGDIFTFHEHYHATDKASALKAVAAHYNIAISAPKAQQSAREKSPPKPKNERQQAIFEATVLHYCSRLRARKDMLEWLTRPKAEKGRGHTLDTVNHMEIGLSDGKLFEALIKHGFSADDIKNAGLYVERERKGEKVWCDFFVPSLFIFPHRLETGEIGHFTIKDPAKKIDYQLKSEHRDEELLFGNQGAIKHDTVIVCEGENDLGSFIDAGHKNALATLGQLSTRQIQWLVKHSNGKKFILFFDNDTKYGDNFEPPAGIKYTRKLYMHLLRQPDCDVRVASGLMAPGEDPDDWIQGDVTSAGARIKNAVFKAQDPMSWEVSVLPDHLKDNLTAVMDHLKEIEFFSSMSYLQEFERNKVADVMQTLGFQRTFILDSIEAGYGLKDIISDLHENLNEGKNPSELFMRAVSTRAWSWFKERGKFFVTDDEPFLFYKSKIYKMGSNLPWQALLLQEADLNFTMPATRYIHQQLRSMCFLRGERVSTLTWVHYAQDKDQPVLYINLNDPGNRIMRISPGKAELVDNGTNPDQVLLANSHQMSEFNFDPGVDIEEAMKDLDELVFKTISCDPLHASLVLAWTLSAFFLPLTPARALMKMEGGSASGKTTAAKYCSLLLYGNNMVSNITAAAAYSMGATEPMLIMDNLETDDINKMMKNFLLLASTGAAKMKRKTGSDSEVSKEIVNCLVAITAIEPLTLPEMINRTYLVQFDKKYRRSDFIDGEFTERLLKKRDSILSAWFLILANKVLPRMADFHQALNYLKFQYSESSKERVKDHMAILAVLAKTLHEYIPMPKYTQGPKKTEFSLIDDWMIAQNAGASENESGTNQLLHFLDSIRSDCLFSLRREDLSEELLTLENSDLGLVFERKRVGKSYSLRFETTTQGLLYAFQKHARERGIRAPWSSARQLGARIGNEAEVLNLAGWTKEHSRTVRGARYDWYVWSPDDNE